jgi:hypothetical protein
MSSSARPGHEDGSKPGIDDAGDLWSWSVDTSRAITERLMAMYRDVGTSAIRLATGDLDGELRRVRLDAERLADLSAELFDRMVVVTRRLAERNGTSSGPPDIVSLQVEPGHRGSAQVWVHNVSNDDHQAPTVFCTELIATDGSRIPGTDVVVQLADDPISARNSRSVLLTVQAPVATTGVYRGWLLSDADPESAIAVRVDVGERQHRDGDDSGDR